jgi:hypothetical protein
MKSQPQDPGSKNRTWSTLRVSSDCEREKLTYPGHLPSPSDLHNMEAIEVSLWLTGFWFETERPTYGIHELLASLNMDVRIPNATAFHSYVINREEGTPSFEVRLCIDSL